MTWRGVVCGNLLPPCRAALPQRAIHDCPASGPSRTQIPPLQLEPQGACLASLAQAVPWRAHLSLWAAPVSSTSHLASVPELCLFFTGQLTHGCHPHQRAPCSLPAASASLHRVLPSSVSPSLPIQPTLGEHLTVSGAPSGQQGPLVSSLSCLLCGLTLPSHSPCLLLLPAQSLDLGVGFPNSGSATVSCVTTACG